MTRTLAAVVLASLACGDGSQRAADASTHGDGSRIPDTTTTSAGLAVSPSLSGSRDAIRDGGAELWSHGE